MAGLLIPDDALPPPRDAVAETLRRWAAQPFVWGTSDCFQSVLAYVESVTGGVLEQRPVYDGPFGAARFLHPWGGFEPYCGFVLAALGCTPVDDPLDDPVRGDVALVEMATNDAGGRGLALCLCTGNFWAARGERQVVFSRAAPVAAWRVTASDQLAGGAPCLR